MTTEAPLLTTSTAEVGTAITPQEFQTLPVILSDGGRPLDAFVWESMPGTTPDWNGRQSINGGQDSSHLILIDGASIARYDWDNMGEFQPGADSVGEFKVQLSNYSAEYGETGGGVVNFSLKSGNNQFHGAGFEYNVNPMFNADGLLNNAYGSPKSTYKENNFGGNLGGPIRKNKTFFFFNYEGDRYSQYALRWPHFGADHRDAQGKLQCMVGQCSGHGRAWDARSIKTRFTTPRPPDSYRPALLILSRD